MSHSHQQKEVFGDYSGRGKAMDDFLKCTSCGHPLKLVTGSFDGCDEDSEAGEGSGYDYLVYLSCDSCGRIYDIVRYRQPGDVSAPIEKLRSFKY